MTLSERHLAEIVEYVAMAIEPGWAAASRNTRNNALITARVAIKATFEAIDAIAEMSDIERDGDGTGHTGVAPGHHGKGARNG